MAKALGVLCNKTGFKWSVVRGPVSALTVLEEDARSTPANVKARGSQLEWIHREFTDLVARVKPDVIYLSRSDGAAYQRHEVEGVVQLAAHGKKIEAVLRLSTQVRKAFDVPATAGAYDALFTLPEVAARSNKDKRTTYLLAVAGLRDLER